MKNKHQSNGKEVGQSVNRLKATEFHLEKKMQAQIHTSFFIPKLILYGLKF